MLKIIGQSYLLKRASIKTLDAAPNKSIAELQRRVEEAYMSTEDPDSDASLDLGCHDGGYSSTNRKKLLKLLTKYNRAQHPSFYPDSLIANPNDKDMYERWQKQLQIGYYPEYFDRQEQLRLNTQ